MASKVKTKTQADDIVVRERPIGSAQRDAIQRRPAFIGGGALLAILAMLLGAFVLGANGKQRALLALSRDVPAGTAITREMLRVERVGGGVQLGGLSNTSIEQVVGQVTRVPLYANTLLQPEYFAARLEVPAGFAIVPMALDEGEAPSALRFGDRVNVISTPNSGTEGAKGGIIAVASVYSAGRDSGRDSLSSSTRRVISLVVRSADEVNVVQGIARGEVRLTSIPGGSIYVAESRFPQEVQPTQATGTGVKSAGEKQSPTTKAAGSNP